MKESDQVTIRKGDALIVVDVQNDFCTGGSLAVKEGERVIAALNMLIPKFHNVVFTRDWHPENHCSFAEKPTYQDKSWPKHCVQDSFGAQFYPTLTKPHNVVIINKGTDATKEAYSGFQETNLSEQLHKKETDRVFVGGLATDYCVKATALDAVKNGFKVYVLLDACRGVDIPTGTAQAALDEMKQAGCLLVNSNQISAHRETSRFESGLVQVK